MRHVVGALGAEPLGGQLVARPERSVEEHAVGVVYGLAHDGREAARRRKVGEAPARGRLAYPEADIVFRVACALAFEMDGKLARNGHRLDPEPAALSVDARELALGSEGEGAPRDLAGESLERPVEDIAVRESAAHALGGVHHERVGFAERQEAQGVVEIAVGEDDGLDGRVSRRLGMQAGKALDLLPDLRRRVQEEPAACRPS